MLLAVKKILESKNEVILVKKQRDEFQTMAEISWRDYPEMKKEKNRQVTYLEKENLQFMVELKKKKECQHLRAEKKVLHPKMYRFANKAG